MKVKKTVGHLFRLLLFVLLAALLFWAATPVLIPKWSDIWRTTETVRGFYDLEEDSLDTLILGTSQVVTGISAPQLYQEAGIRAYTLGTPRQPMLCSYYYLRDALRLHPHLKSVVLEVNELFRLCDDPSYHKALDYMPMSQVKREAIRERINWARQRDAEQGTDEAPSRLNYLLPLVNYHSRWNELSREDFTVPFSDPHDPQRGFSIRTTPTVKGLYQPLNTGEPVTYAQPDKEALHFFRAICALCREKKISLVLVKTPRPGWTTPQWTADKFQTVLSLSREYDIPYLDFNTVPLLQAIGFQYRKDILRNSESHLTLSGAGKLTAYLGDYLTEHCGAEDRRGGPDSAALEADLTVYRQRCEDARLPLVTDWRGYLSRLSRRRYSLLIALRADEAITPSSDNCPEAFRQVLTQLGLDSRACQSGHYVAVLENSRMLAEQWGEGPVSRSAVLADGTSCSLASDGDTTLNAVCSIKLGAEEQTILQSGIQIVVYNHETGTVVDKAALQFNPLNGGILIVR